MQKCNDRVEYGKLSKTLTEMWEGGFAFGFTKHVDPSFLKRQTLSCKLPRVYFCELLKILG